jgi:hypothetical protein
MEGEHILVIGNPEGMTGTVSDGMVSANRDDEFQISAPISAGSERFARPQRQRRSRWNG